MTTSTLLVTNVDRAIKTLATTQASLAKTVAELGAMTATTETLASDIQQKESQLAALELQFNLEYRNRVAELNTRVKENEFTVLSHLLSERGAVYVSQTDFATIKGQLAAAEADNSKQIADAVAATERSLHAKYNSEISQLKSTHAVEGANVNAKVSSLEDRNNFLIGEIAELRKQIDDERKTRLAIAQADASRQGVVVNAGKQ